MILHEETTDWSDLSPSHTVCCPMFLCRLREGVEHFKVLQDVAGKYFIYMVRFSSLNQLVQYHQTSFISQPQAVCLTDPQDEVGKTNEFMCRTKRLCMGSFF